MKLLVNDAKGITKVFDNIGYHSEVFTNGLKASILIDQETFNRMRFYTDFQNSDWIEIEPGVSNIRKVEREWQSPIGKNALLKSFGATPVDVDIFDPANLDKKQLFKGRLRDKYLTIEFELHNEKDRRFLLNYLKTYYRFSRR